MYVIGFAVWVWLLMLGTLRPEEALNDHPLAVLLAALRYDRRLIEIEIEPLGFKAAASASILPGEQNDRLARDESQMLQLPSILRGGFRLGLSPIFFGFLQCDCGRYRCGQVGASLLRRLFRALADLRSDHP